MCIIQIGTTCTCSSAYKLVEKSNLCPWVHAWSHARNGNEFQTPGHRWLPAKHWNAWFLNSSKSKTHLEFMKLGMLSWSGINMPWYKFCPIWGRFGHHPSHKQELLTTSMMVFGRERPTFGDKTISIASYLFQVFFSCQHRTIGVLCEVLWFFGVRLDIFMH